jgi:hypothetical protein
MTAKTETGHPGWNMMMMMEYIVLSSTATVALGE